MSRVERRPLMDRVPRVRVTPLAPPLPDDHLLIWLAHAAGSRAGFTANQRQMLTHPTLAKFAPALVRLHNNARLIYRRHGPQPGDRIRWLVDAALVDLTDMCTATERRRLKATPHHRQNGPAQ